MRVLLLSLVVAAIAVPGVGAASSTARIRVETDSALVVRGSGFHPGEHVLVRATGGKSSLSKRVTATLSGTFVSRLRAVPAGCSLGVVAIGDRGSRATWKAPPMSCGTEIAP
jgi:hypothetical protein